MMRSGLILTIAQWVSIAVVALVLFIMAYILLLRALLLLKERRYHDLLATWRPILSGERDDDLDRLPRIKYADRFTFLILWNMLREERGGDAKTHERMNRVAAATGIEHIARQLLDRRSIRKKLLAIVTLGQLRDRTQWDKLCEMAASEHTLLSLAATQAIARIDPGGAVSIVVPLAVRRAGWPAAKVASILTEIGPDLVSKPLTDAIRRAPDEDMQRLIPYLETCHDASALSTVRHILEEPHDDKVVGPCLAVIGKFRDKHDLKLVRHYLTHPRWHVRAHAAACLGRIGTVEDEKKLTALLADHEWWVRYRAAQAIVNLSHTNIGRVLRLKDALSDRYARDILAQALAERG